MNWICIGNPYYTVYGTCKRVPGWGSPVAAVTPSRDRHACSCRAFHAASLLSTRAFWAACASACSGRRLCSATGSDCPLARGQRSWLALLARTTELLRPEHRQATCQATMHLPDQYGSPTPRPGNPPRPQIRNRNPGIHAVTHSIAPFRLRILPLVSDSATGSVYRPLSPAPTHGPSTQAQRLRLATWGALVRMAARGAATYRAGEISTWTR